MPATVRAFLRLNYAQTMKNPYNIMAAVAAISCVPCLYVAGISVIVGNASGWLLAVVGITLAYLSAVYEERSHQLREWLTDNHSIQ